MAPSNTPYQFSPKAYAIPLLHAAQHPSSTVQGVFLASAGQGAGAGASPSGSTISPILIEEAIPLLHIDTYSTPFAEVALDHVSVYARRSKLRIVGVYEVSSSSSGSEEGPSRAMKGLLKGLVSTAGIFGAGAGEAALLFGAVIDEKRLGRGEIPYTVYTASDTTKPTSTISLEPPNAETPKKVLSLIRDRSKAGAAKVFDFDHHMEDPSADWLSNSSARKVVEGL